MSSRPWRYRATFQKGAAHPPYRSGFLSNARSTLEAAKQRIGFFPDYKKKLEGIETDIETILSDGSFQNYVRNASRGQRQTLPPIVDSTAKEARQKLIEVDAYCSWKTGWGAIPLVLPVGLMRLLRHSHVASSVVDSVVGAAPPSVAPLLKPIVAVLFNVLAQVGFDFIVDILPELVPEVVKPISGNTGTKTLLDQQPRERALERRYALALILVPILAADVLLQDGKISVATVVTGVPQGVQQGVPQGVLVQDPPPPQEQPPLNTDTSIRQRREASNELHRVISWMNKDVNQAFQKVAMDMHGLQLDGGMVAQMANRQQRSIAIEEVRTIGHLIERFYDARANTLRDVFDEVRNQETSLDQDIAQWFLQFRTNNEPSVPWWGQDYTTFLILMYVVSTVIKKGLESLFAQLRTLPLYSIGKELATSSSVFKTFVTYVLVPFLAGCGVYLQPLQPPQLIDIEKALESMLGTVPEMWRPRMPDVSSYAWWEMVKVGAPSAFRRIIQSMLRVNVVKIGGGVAANGCYETLREMLQQAARAATPESRTPAAAAAGRAAMERSAAGEGTGEGAAPPPAPATRRSAVSPAKRQRRTGS